MAKITYNQKTYPTIKDIHHDLKPDISIKLFQQRVSKNKKKGMEEEIAINAALCGKHVINKFTKHAKNAPLKCTGCKQTKPTTEFKQHQTSHTGYKARCIKCGPIKKINKAQQWSNIIGSWPLGKTNQPIAVTL